MEVHVRRRSLLSFLLKIYLLAGVLFGIALFFIGGAMVGHAAMPEEYSLVYEIKMDAAIAGYFLLIIAYIVKYFLLWFEVKLAIRWNWGIGACWGIFILVMCMMTDQPICMAVLFAVSLPYWWMLYKIQYRWEHAAVATSELLPEVRNH